MNRFDRIVSILIQLQSKQIVRAREIAERFDVSLRTVYRDIRTLEEAGVPISGEAGTGYSIVDGYRLPPIMFSREEASSFVAAEKLMEKFTDENLRTHYQSAMFKLKSVLRGKEKEIVSALENNIFVGGNKHTFNSQVPNALEILFEAIAEKRCVNLFYQALYADSPIERTIEPIGIFHENNYWYVMAFCRLRQDYRQFRADRIIGIDRTELVFNQAHETVANLRDRDFCTSPPIEATILVSKSIARYIQNGRHHFGFVSESDQGDWVEMVFNPYDAQDDFPRWLISFGDHAKIIGPDSLKNRVTEILREINRSLMEETYPLST